MKRLVIVASLFLVPMGLFIAAWQAFNYYQIQSEVSRLEGRQQDLIEENKRLVAEYSTQTAAGRIEDRARTELGMDWPRQDQLINLKIKDSQAVSSQTPIVQGGAAQ